MVMYVGVVLGVTKVGVIYGGVGLSVIVGVKVKGGGRVVADGVKGYGV